jgi:peptide/nickel transport system substrate-binding protein
LRSGLVGVIERPALEVLSQLTKDQQARVDSGESTRLVFLQMDQEQVPSPKVSNSGGKNPFQDARVRRAVSLAIDRATLVGETLAGQGVPAGQFMAPSMQGHLSELSPPRSDAALAKRLLAESGFPDGFAVVLSVPEDRIDAAATVAAALAEALTAVGITTTVETLSRGLFYSLRNRQAFSLYLDMLDNPTGDVGFALEALVASRNPAQGTGFANHSGYSNPELDLMLGEAARTIDPARRQAVLDRAVHAALADQALVPLYFESERWGVQSGLRAMPRADGMALADAFRPVVSSE